MSVPDRRHRHSLPGRDLIRRALARDRAARARLRVRGRAADAGRRRAHCRLVPPRRWPRGLCAATGQDIRPVARLRLLRLVLARVEQPRHRLRARVCHRPHALRRRPAADRARGAHLPPIASFLAARRSRAHRRVCGRDRRARASTGSVLRPEGNRLYSMPEQPAPRWAVTPSLRRVQPDRRSRRTRMVACPRRILRPTSRPAGGFGLTIRFRVDPRSRGRPPNAVLVMHR